MKASDIIRRVTAFNSPIFGVSWQPTESDQTVARRVVDHLEDKRVLYAPWDLEVPHHCVESVLELRQYLSHEIEKLSDDTELRRTLRGMRAACRKFLDRTQDREDHIMHGARHLNSWASRVFESALGELRGVVGIHVARLAAAHNLDVADELAVILPAEDSAEQETPPRPRRH
jgi:hypothetical protein